MKNITSFLGFTNTIKEPRKTKVENTLDKRIHASDGLIYNRRTFIINSLLEGRTVEKAENVISYNARTGNQNKPKTEYRLFSIDTRCYMEITKTDFDFFNYCNDHGLNTEAHITDFIMQEELNLVKKEAEAAEANKLANECGSIHTACLILYDKREDIEGDQAVTENNKKWYVSFDGSEGWRLINGTVKHSKAHKTLFTCQGITTPLEGNQLYNSKNDALTAIPKQDYYKEVVY